MKELCQKSGGDWFKASFDSASYDAATDTLLSANVVFSSGDLKNFHQRKVGCLGRSRPGNLVS